MQDFSFHAVLHKTIIMSNNIFLSLKRGTVYERSMNVIAAITLQT